MKSVLNQEGEVGESTKPKQISSPPSPFILKVWTNFSISVGQLSGTCSSQIHLGDTNPLHVLFQIQQ